MVTVEKDKSFTVINKLAVMLNTYETIPRGYGLIRPSSYCHNSQSESSCYN